MASSGEDLSVLILIGMRGCGKTANGVAAAKALGRAFIDLDDVFEEEVRSNCCCHSSLFVPSSLLLLPPL
jgi:dephospho-CoA kinase